MKQKHFTKEAQFFVYTVIANLFFGIGVVFGFFI